MYVAHLMKIRSIQGKVPQTMCFLNFFWNVTWNHRDEAIKTQSNTVTLSFVQENLHERN